MSTPVFFMHDDGIVGRRALGAGGKGVFYVLVALDSHFGFIERGLEVRQSGVWYVATVLEGHHYRVDGVLAAVGRVGSVYPFSVPGGIASPQVIETACRAVLVVSAAASGKLPARNPGVQLLLEEFIGGEAGYVGGSGVPDGYRRVVGDFLRPQGVFVTGGAVAGIIEGVEVGYRALVSAAGVLDQLEVHVIRPIRQHGGGISSGLLVGVSAGIFKSKIRVRDIIVSASARTRYRIAGIDIRVHGARCNLTRLARNYDDALFRFEFIFAPIELRAPIHLD